MSARKSYEERTDLEKIQSQWRKVTGLHTRNESSAAIVRAATAAELAANFAIRNEFQSKSELDKAFVDSLLVWANGIAGKMQRLLIPITKGEHYHEKISKLQKYSKRINQKRNSIAHQGEFCNPSEAEKVIKDSKEFIETLVGVYEQNFALKEKKS